MTATRSPALTLIVNGETHDLYPGRVLRIGRDAGNDIVIPDQAVSRAHAELTVRAGELVVSDVGSRRGTFIRGERIAQPTAVLPGESFFVAGTELRVGTRNLPTTEPGASGRKSWSSKKKLTVLGLVVVIVAALIGLAGNVIGARISKGDPGDTAQLVVGTNPVEADANSVLSGGGYEPGEPVRITIGKTGDITQATETAGELTADGDGRISSTEFHMSAVGQYVVFAKGVRSGRQGSSFLQVVPKKASVIATSTVVAQATTHQMTLKVTKVERRSDWLVTLYVTVTNSSPESVHLSALSFVAVDDQRRSYGIYRDVSEWSEDIPAGSAVDGRIALNHSVDPAVNRLDIRFQKVGVDRNGFWDLALAGITVPYG